jgi:hypothetical protein
MTPKQSYNAFLAQKVIKEFKSRNIQGFYYDTKEEALKKVFEIIPEGSVVSWGGSLTLNEIGLIDSLKKGKYNILDPNAATGGIEKDKIAHQALNSDYYLMSANAISASGELVNIDGIGNRVASLIFGPKSAPLTVLSYKKSEVASFEELLKKAEGSGSQLVITTMSTFKDRIKVILVVESLGF